MFDREIYSRFVKKCTTLPTAGSWYRKHTVPLLSAVESRNVHEIIFMINKGIGLYSNELYCHFNQKYNET